MSSSECPPHCVLHMLLCAVCPRRTGCLGTEAPCLQAESSVPHMFPEKGVVVCCMTAQPEARGFHSHRCLCVWRPGVGACLCPCCRGLAWEACAAGDWKGSARWACGPWRQCMWVLASWGSVEHRGLDLEVTALLPSGSFGGSSRTPLSPGREASTPETPASSGWQGSERGPHRVTMSLLSRLRV